MSGFTIQSAMVHVVNLFAMPEIRVAYTLECKVTVASYCLLLVTVSRIALLITL